MRKIKEGDTITLNLSGVLTEVTIKTIYYDGRIIGQVDDKTIINFKMPNVRTPNRNIIRSFFSLGSRTQ